MRLFLVRNRNNVWELYQDHNFLEAGHQSYLFCRDMTCGLPWVSNFRESELVHLWVTCGPLVGCLGFLSLLCAELVLNLWIVIDVLWVEAIHLIKGKKEISSTRGKKK